MDARGHRVIGMGVAGAAVVTYSHLNKTPIELTPVAVNATLGYYIGTLFPDIDHHASTFGKYANTKVFGKTVGLSNIISHRGPTHTLLFCGAIAGIGGLFTLSTVPVALAWFFYGLAAGSLIHLVGDMITPEGVRLFRGVGVIGSVLKHLGAFKTFAPLFERLDNWSVHLPIPRCVPPPKNGKAHGALERTGALYLWIASTVMVLSFIAILGAYTYGTYVDVMTPIHFILRLLGKE